MRPPAARLSVLPVLALAAMALAACGEQSTAEPVTTSTTPLILPVAAPPVTTTAPPATAPPTTPPATQAPATTAATRAPATTPATVAAYYANCTDARAVGAAPLRRGQAGYRSALDRDGDGIACET